MKKEDLIELGFNQNEAIVYLALAKFGEASALQLIKDLGFHKNIIYDNLEKLIDKGLVTYVIEDGKKVFKIASANMLVELFEEKEKEIDNKKKKAEKISKEINKIIRKETHLQEATIYRGVKGIRTFYRELLEIGKDYIVFGAPKESTDIMGEHFWLNFEGKVNRKKIHARAIFNDSLRGYGEELHKDYIKVKYFREDFEPLTETNIQDNRVAIIVWTEKPILFLIQDKVVADSYRKYFEEMWKRSKE